MDLESFVVVEKDLHELLGSLNSSIVKAHVTFCSEIWVEQVDGLSLYRLTVEKIDGDRFGWSGKLFSKELDREVTCCSEVSKKTFDLWWEDCKIAYIGRV
jgi:hypothetical protein